MLARRSLAAMPAPAILTAVLAAAVLAAAPLAAQDGEASVSGDPTTSAPDAMPASDGSAGSPDAGSPDAGSPDATMPEGSLPDGVAATVNGRAVPALALENVVGQLGAEGQAPDRERVLGELIDLEMLTQEAEKLGIERRPDIAAVLQLQYTQTMANAYLAAIGEEMEVGEEELRAEYERQTANLAAEEYRAAHVLLEDEAAAREVVAALADGADFATLAAERSIDPAGADNGGDLGWFQAASMPPEFGAALGSMEPGDTSEPIGTDYGWHVIRLAEKRAAALPDFESVKPGLENLVLRNRLAAKVEALRETTEVVRR